MGHRESQKVENIGLVDAILDIVTFNITWTLYKHDFRIKFYASLLGEWLSDNQGDKLVNELDLKDIYSN